MPTLPADVMAIEALLAIGDPSKAELTKNPSVPYAVFDKDCPIAHVLLLELLES
jgi:hypothetical protein